jgi:hypothetical protein
LIKADFDESKHPRDEHGKFTEGESTDMGHDSPGTHVATHLQTFDGVKAHLGKGTKIILSAEKSNLRPEENRARSVGLKHILNNYADDVTVQEGKWGGSTEKSYLATVNPESIKELQGLAFDKNELNQEALIVIQDGKVELRFQDGSVQHAEVKDMSDAVDANDNYSKIGNVKYRLNFHD